MEAQTLHATSVALDGVAVLLRGDSGAGKSDLALRLIDQGWELVSDDQTEVSLQGEQIVARAPAAIFGQMEVRGLGIREIPAVADAPVGLVVDLVESAAVERLPETSTVEILGVQVPHVMLNGFEASAVAKLRLALRTQRDEADPDDVKSAAAAAAKGALPVVLVTGLSGAGRSTALKALEDLGYEAIDNLPLDLLPKIVEEGSLSRPVAVGIDIRTRKFAAAPVVKQLNDLSKNPRLSITVLFLECDKEILGRRYTATRRRHPLAEGRRVLDGISAEQRLVKPLRSRADRVIDTSSLTPADLGQVLKGLLGPGHSADMAIFVTSFSFAQGVPQEADFVFDMRFLSNPYYRDDLRPLSGRDGAVAKFVQSDEAFDPFFAGLADLITPLVPRFEAGGKSYLTLAFGCTGGRHRSVATAELFAQWLRDHNRQVTIHHRDITRDPQRHAEQDQAKQP